MKYKHINLTEAAMKLRVKILLAIIFFTLILFITVQRNDYSVIRISKPYCSDHDVITSVKQKYNFFVFYNYVPAQERFRCDESITYTAPADYRFLDNLLNLVEVWNGPISVSLYAPGYDFKTTIDSIAYLRQCTSPKIKELVSFHLFSEASHLYKHENISLINLYKDYYNCSDEPPFKKVPNEETYKAKNNLQFPINMARNIAREAATTHFILALDIELIPTRNLISKFFEFRANNKALFTNTKRNVFVLPIFEIEANESIPENKTELQEMVKNKRAFFFHQHLCSHCHKVIKGDQWLQTPETKGLGVFTVGKRYDANAYWEPFYISDKTVPVFEERNTWEGQSDKMSQAYSLCLLSYDFNILDNAFITHKSGVKKSKIQNTKWANETRAFNKFLRHDIKKQLIQIYGENKKCTL